MSNQPKIYKYKDLSGLAARLRGDLVEHDFVLLYAHNGTGKTRLSIEFKNKGKKKINGDTLYFNAFTEDLFHWDNDLENDMDRVLKINADSKFFNAFKELSLEEKIFAYLERYAEFDFKFDYEKWEISFSKQIPNPKHKFNNKEPEYIIQNNIKISRGEENIFIWCIFLAICELTIDGAEAYNWVKYIYIDDPISSLDDNNAIAVASDLSQLLKRGKDKVKSVISSHHSLFFNVVYNELKQKPCKRYFLHKNGTDGYTLQATDETPFFHHIAILSELKQVMESGKINTYHFNMLRSILEKTSTFFGYDDFSKCIHGVEDEVLYSRALNLLSHGKYSIYEPVEMGDDNKILFIKILRAFLDKYQFDLPILLIEEEKEVIDAINKEKKEKLNMTVQDQKQLGKTLWEIADGLRGAMNADDFRDYMLSFLFLRYLSDNYEEAVKKELGRDYPQLEEANKHKALGVWYKANEMDVPEFEKQMRRKVHYVIKPQYLWSNISEMARTQNGELLQTLEEGFRYIENESFESTFQGLFSEINLNSEKLGRTASDRNKKLCTIIQKIAEGIARFSTDTDILGDAYEYLIGQFAAGSGKKAGEFYTPQQLSTILSKIVILDSQDPALGEKNKLDRVLDFACGSGSLLLNVRRQLVETEGSIGKIYGQEKNITTYNLARMNMLLHGLKDTEFEIHHGDTLINDWNILNEMNPAKKMEFDAIVANPPFSLRWEPNDTLTEDFRFKNYGIAPKSAADFAFLLHGFHFLSNGGTMAIILPHGVLFRSGAEERIRTKLLKDNNIDTVIGLPSNLFFSTGIPVCILVLKKCKKFDDVLFINASEHFEKEKRQNRLREGEDGKPNDIQKIIETYQFRKEEERYSRRVSMDEIEQNGYNLNISRYVSTFKEEEPIDIHAVMAEIKELEAKRADLDKEINVYLKELGLIE